MTFLLGYPVKEVLSPASANVPRLDLPIFPDSVKFPAEPSADFSTADFFRSETSSTSATFPAVLLRTAWPALLSSCLILCLGLSGCCKWTDKSGTRHTLIIGIGVVSVNESKPEAAQVVRASALGISAGTGGFTAGYSSRFSTSVPAGAEDVRIEASQHPFAPVKIEVQKAQLNQTNQNNPGDKHP
jgi:hypothetical protein